MKRACFLLFIFSFHFSTFAPLCAQRTITTERIEVTNRLDEQPDPEAMAIMKRYKASVDSVMAPILGESLVGMSPSRPESLLSNWAADVLVEFSDFRGNGRADLGLVNIGGLRNNMPKGVVRRGDILLISPFDNRLAVAYLKGSDLMELFRNIAAVHGEGVSREVRLEITGDGRLLDAKVSGKAIDPERIYRIATLDYLAEGNDRMFALKSAQKLDLSDLYTRDCMMQSIQRAGRITSKLEGRIVVK